MRKTTTATIPALILLAAMASNAVAVEPAATQPGAYTTRFALTENPISENGHWINGKSAALDWGDISTTPGLAVGHAGPARYADATALLTGSWGPDQSAEAAVYAGKTFNYPEVSLRLRSSLSPHVATGYEISNRVCEDDSGYLIIVRWNGKLADFTYLANLHGKQYGVKNGDVVRATIIGNVITAYKNGVELAHVTDDTFAAGNPGMGFNEGSNGDYGFTRFAASEIGAGAGQPRADEKPALWFYYPVNLLPPANVDKLETIWRRAAAAGYDHVLLGDSKFNHLATMPPGYFRNCERVKQIAKELKIQIVPSEFDIGYSNDLLGNDPNLAEGLPVKGTLFVVHDGEAKVEADPPVALRKPAFVDSTVRIEGDAATVQDNGQNARFVFHLNVPQYRCYHVSVEIKTQDYTGHPEIHPIAGKRTLNYQNVKVARTQDWKKYDIVFDSLDNTDVNLYFGVWGEAKGTLIWKDWKIEEAGLMNVLRRDGTPCVVASEDGKPYVEGTDYQPISDPKMGTIPWPGEYTAWHEPPVIKTKLPEGTRLRVSWYYPPIVYDEEVSACISDPKFQSLLVDQSKRMKELWGSSGYMMAYDEFRCFNWDESCEARKLTPGQMLADSVRQCTKLVEPQEAYTWNDMFDPFHNAVEGPYYLVNGPWTGSWEGLDKSVIIMNWNHGKRDQSLKFFADRGNRQILCGFYDNDLSQWKQWLDSGAKVMGIVGYMYTTWAHDYSKLEDFAKMSREQ